MYDAPERTVRGLKDGPTRSRAARQPPTRSRVPWTRRTSPLSGRSPPSMFRIPPAPPRTAGAWSSAPGGESGRRLRGEKEHRWDGGGVRSSSTGAVFLQAPPPPGYRDKHLHVDGGSAFFSTEHMVAVFTCSSSRSGGRSWAEELGSLVPTRPRRFGRLFPAVDSASTIGSCCPTASPFCHCVTTGHAPWISMVTIIHLIKSVISELKSALRVYLLSYTMLIIHQAVNN